MADKKYRKNFENAVKNNPNITLLGVEMIIRGNTMVRICEHHNPHLLVVYNDVPEKEGIKIDDVISFVQMKRPNMRIVYVFGTVNDNNKEQFTATAEHLMTKGIFDIIANNNEKEITEIIEHPMSENDIRTYLESLNKIEIEEDTEEIIEEESELSYDELNLDFPSVTSMQKFDIDKVQTIVHSTKSGEKITIGVTALQHHLGCTHTSFEIATLLSKNSSVALVISDNATIESYADFYKIASEYAKEGINVNGIDVYPLSRLQDAQENYSAVICDIGYLNEEHERLFKKCNVKIMLCSAAEWDISHLIKYVQFPNESNANYLHQIRYCFSRVSQSKFIKYNKFLSKSGVVAYRLHNSPEWAKPRTENMTIYKNILGSYINLPEGNKKKRKLFRVK